MRIDTSDIPRNITAEYIQIGVHMANTEFASFQERGRSWCRWTSGEYSGTYHAKFDAVALDQIIDDAASKRWEELWAQAEATR